MAKASVTSPVRMRPAIACPMIFFEKQSMTTAGWANPCQVGIYVMSPTHFIPGAVAVTSRAQPVGPAREIRRRHDPSWPVPGVDGQRDPLPP